MLSGLNTVFSTNLMFMKEARLLS